MTMCPHSDEMLFSTTLLLEESAPFPWCYQARAYPYQRRTTRQHSHSCWTAHACSSFSPTHV